MSDIKQFCYVITGVNAVITVWDVSALTVWLMLTLTIHTRHLSQNLTSFPCNVLEYFGVIQGVFSSNKMQSILPFRLKLSEHVLLELCRIPIKIVN